MTVKSTAYGPTHIAIITNSLAPRQESMIGYGEMMLRELPNSRYHFSEMRAISFAAHLGGGMGRKALLNVDRFLVSPLRFALRHANIVHVVDPGNAIYAPLMRASKTVVTVHDLIPYLCVAGELQGFSPSHLGRFLMGTILRILHKVDRIVTVSRRTSEDLQRIAGIAPGKIRVIPNAVFQSLPSRNFDRIAELRATYQLPPRSSIILHIGRNFYKNRSTVLSAFELVASKKSDAYLVLVGAPEGRLADTLGRSPYSGRVIIIDRIAEVDLARLYTMASVLLFPSLYEGFGYPVIEAQICGTPVVCSDCGSLPEVAGDGAVLHAPHDAAGFANTILAILEDQAFAADLAQRGRDNAARFSMNAWQEAHHTLYDELVD